MIEMPIYYDDLSKEAKERFDKLFGPPQTFNHAIVPLFVYQMEEDKDWPEYDCSDEDRQL